MLYRGHDVRRCGCALAHIQLRTAAGQLYLRRSGSSCRRRGRRRCRGLGGRRCRRCGSCGCICGNRRQVLGHHIAGAAVYTDLRPAVFYTQHLHSGAVSQTRHNACRCAGALAHVQLRAAAGQFYLRQHGIRAGRCGRRGRCRRFSRRSCLSEFQILGHHVAGGIARCDPAPAALAAQYLHRRAVLHLCHDGSGSGRALAHVQPGGCAVQLHRRADDLRRRCRLSGGFCCRFCRDFRRCRRFDRRLRFVHRQIFGHHVTGHAVYQNIRPVALRAQHLYARAVLDGSHNVGCGAGGLAHIQLRRCVAQLHRRHLRRWRNRSLRRCRGFSGRAGLLNRQILGHHIAGRTVHINLAPGFALLQYLHGCAVLDGGHNAGGCGRALAHIQLRTAAGQLHCCQLSIRRKCSIRRNSRFCIGSRMRYIGEQDIAGHAVIRDLAPSVAHAQQLQHRAVGDFAQQRGCGAGVRSQVQRSVRTRQSDRHRIARSESGPGLGHAIVDVGLANGIGHRHLFQRGAGIVEFQNILIGFSIIQRHDARAVLAHAHAMSIAAEGYGIRAGRLGDHNGLIIAGIDRQSEQAFNAAVGIDIAAGGEFHRIAGGIFAGAAHRKLQLFVQNGRRCIPGRMRHDGRDLLDGNGTRRDVCLGDRRRDAGDQPAAQRGIQRIAGGGITRNGGAARARRRRFQIVRVILYHAVGKRAAPHVFGAVRLTAVAGGIVAFGEAAAGIQQAAGGLVYRLDHLAVRRIVALVHLRIGVIGHIIGVVFARVRHDDRVISRGHGLRLQRLQRPAVAHLVGDHAVKVILNVHVQHGNDRAAAGVEHQIAAEHIAHGRIGKLQSRHAGALSGKRHFFAHAIAFAADGHRQFSAGRRYGDRRTRRYRNAAGFIRACRGHRQAGSCAQSGQFYAHHAALLGMGLRHRARKAACAQHAHQYERQHTPQPVDAVSL